MFLAFLVRYFLINLLYLYYLFLNVGQVLSKEKLIEYLWNDEYYLDETILLVNINRLRKKLDDIGLSDFVKTKRGVGYFI